MPKKKTTETTEAEISQPKKKSDPFFEDDVKIRETPKAPCDLFAKAYIPYWEKNGNNVSYGVDEYIVCGLCGYGDDWVCQVKTVAGEVLPNLEPNVDVFFSLKEAERRLSSIKKMEDAKKLAKWRRR